MKTLCLYYTRTDTTKEVMETVARRIGADLAEYTDGKDRSGVLGYIGACFATVKKSLPKVSVKEEIDLKEYDRIIIGMPVWAERPCAIGRAMIKKYCAGLPAEVYYMVTHMGRHDYMTKIKAMDSLLGRPSSGQFSVRKKKNDYVRESAEIAENMIN